MSVTTDRAANARRVKAHLADERRARYFRLRKQGVDRHAAAATVGVSRSTAYDWEPAGRKHLRTAYMTARQDGATRRQAARAAGCSMSATYYWEPGDTSRPSWEIAGRLAREAAAARFEDFCWLLDGGESVEHAAVRVGIAESTAAEWHKRWEAAQ